MKTDEQRLLDNLTATQVRCTKLLEENRALKRRFATIERRWVQLLASDDFYEPCPSG